MTLENHWRCCCLRSQVNYNDTCILRTRRDDASSKNYNLMTHSSQHKIMMFITGLRALSTHISCFCAIRCAIMCVPLQTLEAAQRAQLPFQFPSELALETLIAFLERVHTSKSVAGLLLFCLLWGCKKLTWIKNLEQKLEATSNLNDLIWLIASRYFYGPTMTKLETFDKSAARSVKCASWVLLPFTWNKT